MAKAIVDQAGNSSRNGPSAKPEKQEKKIPLNFLLGCSDSDLDSYVLARLSEVANLRAQVIEFIDQMVEGLRLASLARWFKESDREGLKHAIETEEDAMTWARRMIRGGGDVRLPSLDPGKAARTAAATYRARNLAEGKCMSCPQPLDPDSTRFCTKHLLKSRDRTRLKRGVHRSEPGSRDYLYAGELPEDPHRPRAKRKANPKSKNEVLLQLLQGKEPGSEK